jgi:hypothetical protein
VQPRCRAATSEVDLQTCHMQVIHFLRSLKIILDN